MPKLLIANANGDKDNISVPTLEDDATPESIEAPIQKILNRIAALEAEIAALEAAAQAKGIL